MNRAHINRLLLVSHEEVQSSDLVQYLFTCVPVPFYHLTRHTTPVLAFHFSGEARVSNKDCELVGIYLLISWFSWLLNAVSSVLSLTHANSALLRCISNHLWSDFVILPDQWPSHIQPPTIDSSTSRFLVSILFLKESTTFFPLYFMLCFLFCFFKISSKCRWYISCLSAFQHLLF